MSELNEAESSPHRNPLIWISLVVVGLIIFVFLSGDRGDSLRSSDSAKSVEAQETAETVESGEVEGTIERSVLAPPGLRAREYIEQLRKEAKPYPLAVVFEKAQEYLQEGSLADAHLLYFFAAREDHVPSIMKLGEMSDPNLFRAEDALLDDADVIQAYKWYRKAADMGHQPANERVDGLQQWASNEAEVGNPYARQLLLNFE